MDGSIFGGSLIRHDGQISYDDGAGSELTARLALSRSVLQEAWAIRQSAYVAQGLIEPTATDVLTDHWDFAPSTKVIVVYKDFVPVATVRVCLYAPPTGIDGAATVPAMDVFPGEIVQLHGSIPAGPVPARTVEIARLARDPTLCADSEPVFALYRMASYATLAFEADAIISAVQRHHVPFYRRLGFNKIAAPRPYSKVKAECALVGRVRREGEELRDVLPILRLVSKEDSVFSDFLAGERVPVYGGNRAPPSLSAIFGVEDGNRRPAAVSPAPSRGRELEAAA